MQLCARVAAAGRGTARDLSRLTRPGRLRRALLLAGMSLAGSVACTLPGGCAPPDGDTGARDVSVGLEVEPVQPVVGAARLLLRLTDSSGAGLAGARLQVEANMDHPGMQPVLAEPADLGAGRYAASIDFSMAGSWFVLVEATLADGRVLQRKIDLPPVRPK